MKKAEAREMGRDIIIDRFATEGKRSTTFRDLSLIMGGHLIEEGREIEDCDYPHELWTPYHISKLIEEIDETEPVFVIGLSQDGLDMAEEGEEFNEENRRLWNARSGNPTAGVLVFTDEDEQFFGIDDHKRQMQVRRVNGAIEKQAERDQTRIEKLPSAPHVGEIKRIRAAEKKALRSGKRQ